MTPPPENLQAGYYMERGQKMGKNISGKYRICQEDRCDKWISCPYTHCFTHWKAMIDKDLTDAKEWED